MCRKWIILLSLILASLSCSSLIDFQYEEEMVDAVTPAPVDVTAPVPGNSGLLSLAVSNYNSITVTWTTATDNISASDALEYLLYYSLTNNLDTLSNILTQGTAFGAYTTNITNQTVTGLLPNTLYYFNVLVKDQNSIVNCYSASNFQITAAAPIPGASGSISLSLVTSNSISIRWSKATDDFTPQTNLRYLVYHSTLNNINSVVNILANGTPVGSFTVDITNKTVTGLANNINYYMNILVIDDNSYTNCYTSSPFMITNLAPVPGSSGAITLGSVTTNSIAIRWNKATDDYTAQAGLQYLVYYSTLNNINTVANALANGTPVGSFTADITNKTVTGLAGNINYYMNILVIDGNSYTNCYASSPFMITNLAPVPGSSGTINFDSFSADSITINWSKAADDYTAQSSLQYLVYYSLLNNISTVANVLANGTPAGSFTADITNRTVNGLLNNATYYLNTLVIDANNNTNCYTTRSVTKYVRTNDFNNCTNFIFDTTATGANMSGNVTNFPVLLRITNQVLIDSVQPGAPDIRFMDKDGVTWLNYEIERWDQAANVADVWVLVPLIHGNSTADYITLYYNDAVNGAVSNAQNPKAVFTPANGFQAVWHLGEDAAGTGNIGLYKDSTSNANNGDDSVSATGKTGIIAKGQQLDGVDDSIKAGTFDPSSSDLTISMWIKWNGDTGTHQFIIGKRDTWSGSDMRWQLARDYGYSNLVFNIEPGTGGCVVDFVSDIPDTNNWHQLVVTRDGTTSNCTLYIDGAQSGSTGTLPLGTDTTAQVTFGNKIDGGEAFNGIMDEVRISSVVYSTNWIKLSYENQKPNQSLVK